VGLRGLESRARHAVAIETGLRHCPQLRARVYRAGTEEVCLAPNLHRCRYAAALSGLNLLRSNVALPGANIQKGLAFGRRRSGTDQQPREVPVAPADR
jgi:hypothetical protein